MHMSSVFMCHLPVVSCVARDSHTKTASMSCRARAWVPSALRDRASDRNAPLRIERFRLPGDLCVAQLPLHLRQHDIARLPSMPGQLLQERLQLMLLAQALQHNGPGI